MPLRIKLIFCLFCLFLSTQGQLKFANVFSDNMVLQQNSSVSVWGTAKANSSLKMKCSWLPGKEFEILCDEKGKWEIVLETTAADKKEHQIILSDEQNNTISLKNILLGEVWLCSGQSNMEMILKNEPEWDMIIEGSEDEIANANYPQLRFINIGRKESFEPEDDVQTNGWKVFTPENVKWLSAAGYFFSKKIYSEIDVPIGVIISAYGGSPIQSWLPLDIIDSSAMYSEIKEERLKEFSFSKQSESEYIANMEKWIIQSEQQAACQGESQKINLPVNIGNVLSGSVYGEFSFTREVNLEDVSKDVFFSLGTIDDFGRVFFNDTEVWKEIRNSKSYAKAMFTIPASFLKKGQNKIEVRVMNVLWGGGLTGTAAEMFYQVDGGDKKALTGEWNCKKLFDMSDAVPIPREGKAKFTTASALYNGMIHPLGKYRIKGILWYQGEANIGEANEYATMTKDLVSSWRKLYGEDTPYYYVQIAPYGYSEPYRTNLSELRTAQRQVEEIVPNSAMVVTVDLGDENNIHPAKKREVGERLALQVLEKTYGKKISARYPQLETISKDADAVIMTFGNVSEGLMTNLENHAFELSSDGEHFEKAEIYILGKNKIRVQGIKNPRYIRYCWKNGDIGTIVNSDNMPLDAFFLQIDK